SSMLTLRGLQKIIRQLEFGVQVLRRAAVASSREFGTQHFVGGASSA
ncbi:10955_t:CDS:1, partial [Scutellospora calospora]